MPGPKCRVLRDQGRVSARLLRSGLPATQCLQIPVCASNKLFARTYRQGSAQALRFSNTCSSYHKHATKRRAALRHFSI